MQPKKQVLRKILKSERGEASYISTTIYILVMVILIAFLLNVFQIISTKQKMDHVADQLVKQIQLAGGKTNETDTLFNYLKEQISAKSIKYKISSTDSIDKIQIGTPFYVTIESKVSIGGIYDFRTVTFFLRAKGAGVSEHYWK